MALTQEQEKNNRKAAQLRKKRNAGKGGPKNSETAVTPITLTQMVQKNKNHAAYLERRAIDVQRAIASYWERLKKTGAIIVPHDISNSNEIVNGLKREARRTKGVGWSMTADSVAFAIQKAN